MALPRSQWANTYHVCRPRLYGRRQIRNHPDVGRQGRGRAGRTRAHERTAKRGAADRLSASEGRHTLRENVTQGGKRTATYNRVVAVGFRKPVYSASFEDVEAILYSVLSNGDRLVHFSCFFFRRQCISCRYHFNVGPGPSLANLVTRRTRPSSSPPRRRR